MFIEPLFAIANIWKQPKYVTVIMNGSIWYDIHMMEYSSAMTMNKILPFETTWMDLEGIMLGEVSHREKDKYSVISLFLWNLKTKTNEQRKQSYREQTVGYERSCA